MSKKKKVKPLRDAKGKFAKKAPQIEPTQEAASKLSDLLKGDGPFVDIVWGPANPVEPIGVLDNGTVVSQNSEGKLEPCKHTKYTFVEPHPTGGHCVVTVTAEEAIEWQRKAGKQAGYEYESDERALDDFLAVYWATPVDGREQQEFTDKKVDVVLVNTRNDEEKVLTDVAIKDIPIFNIVDSNRTNVGNEFMEIMHDRAAIIAEEERKDKSWVEKIRKGWLEFVDLLKNGPKSVWTGEYADSKLERVLAKVDGRMCALLYADKNANSDDVEDIARKDDRVLKRIGNRKIVKIVVVTHPTKYINFVTEEVKDDQSK